jgi:nitrate/TMAO reductase-like tetraheme cytochrome c subunit
LPSRAPLLRHPLSVAGVVLTTVSAVVFGALLVAMWMGAFSRNPYAGLVVFIVVPGLFVLGLLMIPFGMWLEYRWQQRHAGATRDWFVFDLRQPVTRQRAVLILVLTAVNLAIVGLAATASVHWMESPTFCGQACHTPMHPQFSAWQDAPHSQIACAECHVGEGSRAFVKYKMSGVRQMYHVVTGKFPRPIPGVADMRPAREVCGTCHWSGKGFGEVIRVKREYADDESNSETATILQLHVGGPGLPTPSGRAIHWHADERVTIEFVATDVERQTIPYVRVTDAEGRTREFIAEGTAPEAFAAGERRTMDCIDCHNVVAHRISPTAEQAVDRAIAAGRISRELPFIRREGVRLAMASHETVEAGARAIDEELRRFYTSNGRGVDAPVTAAVAALRQIYRRNVFPLMNVKFGTYPDNLGHITSSGCFRCHDGSHMAKDGTSINADCEYCHKQLDAPP